MVFRSTIELVLRCRRGTSLAEKWLRWIFSAILIAGLSSQVLAEDKLNYPESSYLAPSVSQPNLSQQADIDWNKAAVSRNLGGRTVSTESESIQMRASYGAGQTAYFFRNYLKAYSIWLPLAEQGFADAQASLAWLYQAGLGLQANERIAYEWYLKAAEQGHAVAQNNLGVMYEQGRLFEQDMQKATAWYESSAKQGYRFAQYNLAKALLKNDQAKRQDIIHWLSAAAEQGVKQAAEQLQNLQDPIIKDP